MLRMTSDAVWQSVSESLAAAGLGAVAEKRVVGGGSINTACHVKTERGTSLFIKLNRESLLPMFEAEFEGLQALRKPQTIRVPEPVSHGSGHGHAWLITEYIPLHHGTGDTSPLFGRQLAGLHCATTARFGWHRDNTIGSTPQRNEWSDSWIEFFRTRRLGFQLEQAAQNGFNGSLRQKGERLMADLDRFFDAYTPVPSLLHGDLWCGNQAADDAGQPVIFDPAVYYGDREADLAMTELFGGFSGAFYDAYNEAWPLDAGYNVRKTLYNLYHILNHANLFAGGYVAQAGAMMDHLLAEL